MFAWLELKLRDCFSILKLLYLLCVELSVCRSFSWLCNSVSYCCWPRSRGLEAIREESLVKQTSYFCRRWAFWLAGRRDLFLFSGLRVPISFCSVGVFSRSLENTLEFDFWRIYICAACLWLDSCRELRLLAALVTSESLVVRCCCDLCCFSLLYIPLDIVNKFRIFWSSIRSSILCWKL